MDVQEGVSSEPSVSLTAHADKEILVENVEGQANETSNQVDGGEIMVEVVGSSVFVDGVCGGGVEVGSRREAVALDEHLDFQSRNAEDSSKDVSEPAGGTEATEDVVRPADMISLDVVGSYNEAVPDEAADKVSEEDPEGKVVKTTVSVESSADLTLQRVAASDDGVWNPGIQPLAGIEEASNQRFASSEKNESSVGEIVGQARDQPSHHLAEGAVSHDCTVMENSHSEVDDVHDQEMVILGNGDGNSNKGSDCEVVEKAHADVETMETETVGLAYKDEKSHQDCKTHSEAAIIETNVCDQETVILGNNNENSHPDVEPMENDGHIQDGGLHNNDYKGERDTGAVSGISVEHAQVAYFGSNGGNVPSFSTKQEVCLTKNLAVENGAIVSSEKLNHAEVGKIKVDTIHENRSDLPLCTQPVALHMDTQMSNHKEVSLESSEVSCSKILLSSDKVGSLSGSDELPDMQTKVVDGIHEVVTLVDFPLSSEPVSAHDRGNFEEMEVDGVVEVDDVRLENCVRIGPLESHHQPACSTDGVSGELDKEGDSELGTTTTSSSCIVDKKNSTAEKKVPPETMVSTGEMNTGDETNCVKLFLPEGLDGDISLLHVENESLLLVDDYAGKEGDLKMNAMSSKDSGAAQSNGLAIDTGKCVATEIVSNITEESECIAGQESVVHEMDLGASKGAPVDETLNEENKSISCGALVPPQASDQTVETCISHTSNAEMSSANEDHDSLKSNTTTQESSEIASVVNHSVMSNKKPVSLLKIHPGYLNPPENEGCYCVSDLVWGKVRSHPWWPGQIFDPSNASDKAMKYHKKDSFLVAYFGDHTFAWNDASVLKPFCSYFSHIEKQSTTAETFQIAVSCALEEVCRRVELGLACSCIPQHSYDKISCQVVENAGVSEGSSKRYGVDKSTGVASFRPDKLVHYMKAFALSPRSRADRLDLTIAQAQLGSFCRFKGYRLPPEFLLSEGLVESVADVDSTTDHASEDSEQRPTSTVSAHKRKHSSKDSLQSKKKEKSLSELMDNTECEHSPVDKDDSDEKTFTSSKKRKAIDSLTLGSDKRTSVYAAKVSPKPFFRVGECIQRVASQLTRPASVVKCNSDQTGANGQLQDSPKSIPTELPSPNELLSQLQLVAWAPLKGHHFLKTITSFFSGFRNSVALSQHSHRPNPSVGKPSGGGGRKKRASQTAAGFSEEYEFDDVNDSYWTDRVVENCGEEQQALQDGQSVEVREHRRAISDAEKTSKAGRRSYTRKRKPGSDIDMTPVVSLDEIERRRSEPAELILKFAEGGRPLPSEMNLNKMFRRFGPLKELETEVGQEARRARVVFKRGADAEVAHSSMQKFNIFGSCQVTYELNYTPVISFKPMLLTTPEMEGAI